MEIVWVAGPFVHWREKHQLLETYLEPYLEI